ncbi:MAG: SDR family oxidoreductase, partial [Acidimicrobiaceae bacterium]|nr:SDR family oxidoreductase [Acidimicrobiaceae bacterium]
MDLLLSGKRAVVTGGSRGIGLAVAKKLIAEGARVAILARTPERLKAAAEEIGAVPVVVDTNDDDSVRQAIAEAADALGGIDILVNSAAQPSGQAAAPKVLEVNNESFYADMNVKVLGYLRTIREVTPHMKAAGGGRIVNISGLGARTTGSVIGSMRNVAVSALTKNAADELGPAGIGVVVVHPGYVRTEATPAVLAWRAENAGTTVEEIERRLGAANALGRIVDAEEVATVVTFLASPLAQAVNGDAVTCGGGSR